MDGSTPVLTNAGVPTVQQLLKYVGDEKVYCCPIEPVAAANAKSSSFPYQNVTYTVPGALYYWELTNHPDLSASAELSYMFSEGMITGTSGFKQSVTKKPSKFCFGTDGAICLAPGETWMACNVYDTGTATGYPIRLNWLHAGETVNGMYADGHVESHHTRQMGSVSKKINQ